MRIALIYAAIGTVETVLMNKHQGNVSIIMVLVLPIIIFILMAAVEFSRHSTLKMRLQHASDNALALIAREGAYVTQDEARYLAQTMMAYNLPIGLRDSDIKRTSDIKVNISPLNNAENISLTTQLSGELVSQWLLPISMNSYSEIQRYFQKKETVLVLDASRSMSNSASGGVKPVDMMREILPDFIDRSLAPENLPQDHLLAFVPYSTNVNLGFDYKDTLITQRSREVPQYLSPLVKHYGYGKDFLSRRGVEGRREGACVHRKKNANDSPVQQLGRYSGQANGFDLLIYHTQEKKSLFDLGDAINRANNNQIPKYLLPVIQVYGQFRVETAAGCPSMPITALTSDRDLLSERAGMYWATHNTGGDEGVIWGWRILNEHWKKAWLGQDKRIKDSLRTMIFFTDGFNNEGTTDISYFKNLCEAIATDNIKIQVVLFDQGIKKQEIEAYKVCAESSGGSLHYFTSLNRLKPTFSKLAIRQYKIRFNH